MLRRPALLRLASHNIMDGLYLPALLARYRRHQRGPHALHALCVQECVPGSAAAIAAALGRHFAVATHVGAPRLAVVYDRLRLRLCGLKLVLLPKLEGAVPLLQRLYTGVEQKHAIIGDFRCRGRGAWRARRVALANFHLDTAGYNSHRTGQMAALARALDGRRRDRSMFACGDTNCFTWDATTSEDALARMIAPFKRRHGAVDAHAVRMPRPALLRRPTHYFARAHEPKLGHRIAVAAGKLGIDFPRRYDVVVASAARVAAAGMLPTPESDHDLVWAAFRK